MSDVCCLYFQKAMEAGTDNEGYGSLIGEFNGTYKMGYYLPQIVYCPWCGKQLQDKEGE